MNFYEKITEVHFKSNNGFHLSVMRKNNFYEMEFPAYELKPIDITDEIINALGLRPKEVLKARDLLCVLDNSQSVVNFKPDLDKIEKLGGLLLHITAYDNRFDCVS